MSNTLYHELVDTDQISRTTKIIRALNKRWAYDYIDGVTAGCDALAMPFAIFNTAQGWPNISLAFTMPCLMYAGLPLLGITSTLKITEHFIKHLELFSAYNYGISMYNFLLDAFAQLVSVLQGPAASANAPLSEFIGIATFPAVMGIVQIAAQVYRFYTQENQHNPEHWTTSSLARFFNHKTTHKVLDTIQDFSTFVSLMQTFISNDAINTWQGLLISFLPAAGLTVLSYQGKNREFFHHATESFTNVISSFTYLIQSYQLLVAIEDTSTANLQIGLVSGILALNLGLSLRKEMLLQEQERVVPTPILMVPSAV